MSTNYSQNPSPLPGTQPVLSSRPPEVKSATAFRTISEVANDLSVPQHVLRFWESKFQQIRPLKRGGGRRYYRPEDVQLISSIKDLLYSQGFTIRGVQKLLKENGRFPSARSMVPDPQVPTSVTALHSPAVNPAPTPRGLSADKRREV